MLARSKFPLTCSALARRQIFATFSMQLPRVGAHHNAPFQFRYQDFSCSLAGDQMTGWYFPLEEDFNEERPPDTRSNSENRVNIHRIRADVINPDHRVPMHCWR